MSELLKIENLTVAAKDKGLLHGVSLSVGKGGTEKFISALNDLRRRKGYGE